MKESSKSDARVLWRWWRDRAGDGTDGAIYIKEHADEDDGETGRRGDGETGPEGGNEKFVLNAPVATATFPDSAITLLLRFSVKDWLAIEPPPHVRDARDSGCTRLNLLADWPVRRLKLEALFRSPWRRFAPGILLPSSASYAAARSGSL